ncbi:hypothetical protein ACFV99_14825 [Streptomyces sp. NPDC059944]|uniref:hypothetical protein n=1 Tax=unclassified Streptomyces TaxID=2593676 RepID=UPI0036473E94
MTAASRPRFTVRAGLADADTTLFTGTPDHLVRPMQKWVDDTLRLSDTWSNTESIAEEICLRLRITPVGGTNVPCIAALRETLGLTLLDVVDEIVSEMKHGLLDTRDSLTRLLDTGGSAYCLNKQGDGLEERVVPAVRDAVSKAIANAEGASASGSAAEHLAAAWKAAYGVHPDPVRAYSEAIKAAESAAHAVIEPNNSKATLGTMLRVIRNAPSKFTTALSTRAGKDPITPVEVMMGALWEGQTSRHGTQTGTVPESLEAARAGVHLATTLVQWFTSGAVVRTP